MFSCCTSRDATTDDRAGSKTSCTTTEVNQPFLDAYDCSLLDEDLKRQRKFQVWGCCRRRRAEEATNQVEFAGKTVVEPWNPPADPLEAEWLAMKRNCKVDEFCTLEKFRLRVLEAGLDVHPACSVVPHGQRATTLLRFLRARGGNVDKALHLLGEAFDWRHEFGMDKKLNEWRAEWKAGTSARVKVMKRYDYTRFVGNCRQGLPVYLTRFSDGDPGGIAREVGRETLLLHHAMSVEDSFDAALKMTLQTGLLRMNFVELHDLGDYGTTGHSMKRGWGAVSVYKEMSIVFDKVYPERVRACFILRCPVFFSIFWRIISPIVPPHTRTKIRIRGFAAKSWYDDLEELLPVETIPLWLRGDDPALVVGAEPVAGVVPEGVYLEEKEAASGFR